jgi:hypothetical protein
MTNNKIAAFADQLTKLAKDYKANRAALLDEVKKADIDPAPLGRLVTWMRKDELARLEQEAVDDQYRFLAGLRPAGAEMPPGSQLATAASLYAEGMTVRDVAKKMGVSVGKAHTLKLKAAAFNVQPHVNMNTSPEIAPRPVAPDDEEETTRTDVSKPAAAPGAEDHNNPAQASKLAADELAPPGFLDRRAELGHSATDPSNT